MFLLFPFRNEGWANDNAVGWTVWQVLIALVTAPLVAVVALAAPQLKAARTAAASNPIKSTPEQPDLAPGPAPAWGVSVFATALAIALLVMLCGFAIDGSLPFNGLTWSADRFPPPDPWPEVGALAMPFIGGFGAVFVGRQAFVLSGGREEFIAFVLLSIVLTSGVALLPLLT